MDIIELLIKRLNETRMSGGEAAEPVAESVQLESLKKDTEATLGFRLPDEYLHMLELCDGLHFSALYIYATGTRPITGHPDAGDIQGVVEDNLDYWSVLDRGWIVLGYWEGYAYAYDVRRMAYFRAIRPSTQFDRSYESFGEMLADALHLATVKVDDIIPSTFRLSQV